VIGGNAREGREGREAVELARRLQPDIVLMDLSMPGLDGLAATRLMAAEMPQVKVPAGQQPAQVGGITHHSLDVVDDLAEVPLGHEVGQHAKAGDRRPQLVGQVREKSLPVRVACMDLRKFEEPLPGSRQLLCPR
jgi:CheY-like chemotaxis protein